MGGNARISFTAGRSGNSVFMPRAAGRFALTLVVLLLVGCGPPGTLAKQADEVHSVAAEGSILAHDASEGDTTAAFARAHTRALRRRLAEVEAVIDHGRLVRVAEAVSRDLHQLGERPGDRVHAAELERRLERAADEADEIAMAA
jgi:hypothetical protein